MGVNLESLIQSQKGFPQHPTNPPPTQYSFSWADYKSMWDREWKNHSGKFKKYGRFFIMGIQFLWYFLVTHPHTPLFLPHILPFWCSNYQPSNLMKTRSVYPKHIKFSYSRILSCMSLLTLFVWLNRSMVFYEECMRIIMISGHLFMYSKNQWDCHVSIPYNDEFIMVCAVKENWYSISLAIV